VVVYDAFGNVAWGPLDVAKTTGTNPAVQYEGPLEKGMFYQFKATSFRTVSKVPISNTEDLRGVFYMP
jgi:hypothetical protein